MATDAGQSARVSAGSGAQTRLVLGPLFGRLELRDVAILATDTYHLWVLAALVADGVSGAPDEEQLVRARERVDDEVQLVSLQTGGEVEAIFEVTGATDPPGLAPPFVALATSSATERTRSSRVDAAYRHVRERLEIPAGPDDTVVEGGHRFSSDELAFEVRLVLNNAVEAISAVLLAERLSPSYAEDQVI